MGRERKFFILIICGMFLLGWTSLFLSACNSSEPSATSEIELSEKESQGNDLDGFPPPIPHALQGQDECLVCHREGEVGKAPKTPHPDFANCRQCHVLSE